MMMMMITTTYPRDYQLSADVLYVGFHLAGDVELMTV